VLKRSALFAESEDLAMRVHHLRKSTEISQPVVPEQQVPEKKQRLLLARSRA
jgi:hypothetical protein